MDIQKIFLSIYCTLSRKYKTKYWPVTHFFRPTPHFLLPNNRIELLFRAKKPI